jgi:hypothetical protein
MTLTSSAASSENSVRIRSGKSWGRSPSVVRPRVGRSQRASAKGTRDMMKRHEIRVLRRAGHTQADVARLSGVSEREVRRIEQESPVVSIDERARAQAPTRGPAIEGGAVPGVRRRRAGGRVGAAVARDPATPSDALASMAKPVGRARYSGQFDTSSRRGSCVASGLTTTKGASQDRSDDPKPGPTAHQSSPELNRRLMDS